MVVLGWKFVDMWGCVVMFLVVVFDGVGFCGVSFLVDGVFVV